MTTTLRTYSKRVPRTTTSFLGAPVANRASDWDELDELMSEGGDGSSKGRGKRKEDFTGKENVVNQSANAESRPTKKVATPTKGSTPTKRSSTPTKNTPTKQITPLTPHKNTPTKPTTPTTPKAAKTPTKTPKSPKTPTRSPKTPTKSPKSPKIGITPPSPAMLKHPSPARRTEDTRALRDELDYLLDGMDSSESEIRRESMHKLALEFRKGIIKGPVGQLLRVSDDAAGAGEAILQRLVDILLLRWDRTFCKDKASFLLSAIILHSLARDPANIPHLSRCQVILRDIVFSSVPTAKGDDIEKQTVTLAANCGAFVAQDDYTSIGDNKNEFQIVASMAIRTLAALSFTRTISDSLRQEGIIEAVVQLVIKWVEKLPSPPPPSSPFLETRKAPPSAPQIDVHALLDIKYSLIILENATFVNPANQGAILKNNCEVIHSIIKLVAITRDIVLAPKSEVESVPCVTLTDAATDCMIGCLKLMLNLTYNHHDACESVRLACASSSPPKPTKSTNKKSKKNPTNEEKTDDKKTEMPLGGLAILLSLLNIQFDEDMFDIHQHVIGLLINLVETNPLNRQQIGSIDGAIAKIVSLYIAQKSAEEQRKNKHSNVGIVGAAYCAMLLGWLAYEHPVNEKILRESLPSECTFASLATILKLFMSFQLQAGILPEDVQQSLTTVITLFERVQ